MRFQDGGPSIPDLLLERCDAGRVVFLCGAGVSSNSGMPTFPSLTQSVIDFFDPPPNSQIMRDFNGSVENESAIDVSLDQIFNLLHHDYGRDAVDAVVEEQLKIKIATKKIGYEHKLIKRISSNLEGVPQIVTTNFDLLFEHDDNNISYHTPPNFPDLELGMKFDGVIYLHGRLASSEVNNYPYVLSSADFGRAYLSEAWATKFIRGLLEHYTVAIVGYRAEDPPMKYLLQGLSRSGRIDRTRLFAFEEGKPEDVEANWRDKGVTSVAYQSHECFWQTISEWADRADNPRTWRHKVVETAKCDPKKLLPHERGQVVHVLRSVPGARLFAEMEPTPHPEWICVLDALTRNARACSGYGDGSEAFEPLSSYGLDDDIGPISDDDYSRGVRNDHLLEWRPGDNSPTEVHRVGGRQIEGRESIPRRIGHIMQWIQKMYHSPVIAWWAARQRGLHPKLIDRIEWHLQHGGEIQGRCRHVWSLILEHHRDSRNRHFLDVSWFNLRKRINMEGWTLSVLREFRRAAQPRLAIEAPMGLRQCMPPTSDWKKIELEDIGHFEVKCFDRHGEKLVVLDEVLPTVFRILEEQLLSAMGILSDIGVFFWRIPTCYSGRESDGGEMSYNFTEAVLLFIELFDKLVVINPGLARAHAMLWNQGDRYFFRKLKLYALSKTELFEANEMAGIVSSFDQKAFWDTSVIRELLFLLVDRWSGISEENQKILANRILSGPDKRIDWSKKEYPSLRNQYAARYGRYLQLKGCQFPDALSSKLEKIIAGIQGWSNGWATSMVTEQGRPGGLINTDETPDVLMGLSLPKIVPRAEADLKREFDSMTDMRPFIGLVKVNPRKALSALTVESRKGRFPAFAWSTLLSDFPKSASPRLYRVFLKRLTLLPNHLIMELRHTVGKWLMDHLNDVIKFDNDLGWRVYDHFFDGILSLASQGNQGGAGQAHQIGIVVRRSLQTYAQAINGPFGMCARALLLVSFGKAKERGSLIPSHIKARIEKILILSGEGRDHAVSILMKELNMIMSIDPVWANEHLIPILAFNHPASGPAWNGLLHSRHHPSIDVAPIIKPQLLELFPWIEDFEWRGDVIEATIDILGCMHVFHKSKLNGLDDRQMRSIVREMSDYARSHMINWLGGVGKKNKDGWAKLVVPFINNVWPRELRLRTAESVSHWVELLDRSNDGFPIVYTAVKKFLAPIDSVWVYCLVHDVENERPIAERYPQHTLDLMNKLTHDKPSQAFEDLQKTLELIEESAPDLVSDARYLRLIDLVERS